MSSTLKAFENIQLEKEGAIARIKINRADTLNALSRAVIQELHTAILEHIVSDSNIRVLVLSGAGDKAFVAGADIKEMSQMNSEEAWHFARQGQALTRTLESMPCITIARVQGYALGGGCELAMACDIIIASKKAKFGQPEVNLGLIPGFGGTQRLAKRIGLPKALDMLCAVKTYSAEEAYQAGLISRVCEEDALDTEINLVIKGILKASPLAVVEAKRLCRESLQMDLESGLSSEASTFAAKFGQKETKIGLENFLNKKS